MSPAPLPGARVAALTSTQIVRARQHALLLGAEAADSIAAAAEWLGALQAQDFASVEWSFGLRVHDVGESDVAAAFEQGAVLRTWPMRGTIHAVPPADTRWMLGLTGTRSLAASKTRRQQLGFDRAVADRAVAVLDAALREQPVLPRPAAMSRLEDAGIDTTGQRGYHLLWYAAVTGATCIGPHVGKQQSVVRLDDWAPQQRDLGRDEALTELTWRFFRSHGPATETDFAGWAGLPLRDVRVGIAGNAGRLVATTGEGADLILSTNLDELVESGELRRTVPTRALPGFDEYILGYKNRAPQLTRERLYSVVPGGNGIFRNTLCVDGRIVGTWQRTLRARQVDVAITTFEPLTRRHRSAVVRALDDYGRFVGRSVRISET